MPATTVSSSAPRRRGLRRWSARAAVGLVVLESILQLGAYLAWRRHPLGPAEAGPVRASTVLCIGGGSAWGVGGTRAAAWPSRLEAVLSAGGTHASRVVNGGAPRLASSDALRRLPELLASYGPEVVVISLGADDATSPARPVAADELAFAEAFPLRCRTWALLDGLVEAIRRPSRDPRGFVGDWHLGALAVSFGPDGHLSFGADLARWSLVGDRLSLTLAAGQPIEVEWRIAGDRLHLDAPIIGSLALERGPPAAAVGQAAELIERGELVLARYLLETDLRGPQPDDAARALLVEIDALEGRAAEAAAGVARLRLRHEERASADSAALLGRALLAVGDLAAAVPLLCEAPSQVGDAVLARLRRRTAGTTSEQQVEAAFAGRPPSQVTELSVAQAETLRANLVRMARICRSYGAEPILLDEPEPSAALADALGRAARHTGVRRIALPPGADAEIVARTVADRLRQ